jgi:hypothetical protein
MKQIPGIFLLAVLLMTKTVQAQGDPAHFPLTADSLASGNYKDVFKSFFQLALNKFTSDNKEIQFTSNPFAVMAKMNKDLLVDKNYLRYTHLRNLNFSFAAKLDSSYRFNGFSSGIKYALVNKRDETVSRAFVVSAFNANDEFNKLNNGLDQFINTIDMNDPRRAKYREQKTKLFRGEINFSQLDPSLQAKMKNLADSNTAPHFLQLLEEDPKLNIHKASQQTYDSLKTLFQNKLLWTAGISDTTYKNQSLFSNVLLSTEMVKGIVRPSAVCNVELNIKSGYQFLDDTLRSGHDLRRQVFNIEPGLNLVLKARRTQYSWAEFKLSGSYARTVRGIYAGEKQDSLSINATLRIRVFSDIWIPLDIKYDPDSGNVFGFLNVRANFTALKELFGN